MKRLYGKPQKKKRRPTLKKGDYVRLNKIYRTFGFLLPNMSLNDFGVVTFIKNGLVGPTGIIRKNFWTHPRKGTIMRLVKNAKTGKYENVYEESIKRHCST